MKNNAICSKCSKEFKIGSHIVKSGDKFEDTNLSIMRNKNFIPLQCKNQIGGCENGGILLAQVDEANGFAGIGKYSACSKDERDRKLRMRAKKHTQKVVSQGKKEEIEKTHVEPVKNEMLGKNSQ